MKRLPTDTGLIDYFWTLVDKNGPLPEKSTGVKSRCWLWIGSIRQDGYGWFNFEGRMSAWSNARCDDYHCTTALEP
jgi:hypothetical protein